MSRRPLPIVLVSRWLNRNGGITGVLARLWRGYRNTYTRRG